MRIELVFGCGGRLTVPRCWLSPSTVLNEILSAADSSGTKNCAVEFGTPVISMINDKLQEWQLLLPLLEAVSSMEVSNCTSSQLADSGLVSLSTASAVLTLADKYDMRAILGIVGTFLSAQEYSSLSFHQPNQASADSGDITSIWYWLRIASRLTQPSLLQHYKRCIIEQQLVPNSRADVSELHPTDLADLLVSFMQQNAAVRYKCLGCAGRHSTEVRLCSRCSFSPHIRV